MLRDTRWAALAVAGTLVTLLDYDLGYRALNSIIVMGNARLPRR